MDLKIEGIRRAGLPWLPCYDVPALHIKVLTCWDWLLYFFADKKYGSEPQGGDLSFDTSEKSTAKLLERRVSNSNEEACDKTSLANEKARSCLICGKTLLGKYALSQHLKQTHEQGPFSCPDCNQIFDSGCKLHEHAGMKNHCASKLPPFRHDLEEFCPFLATFTIILSMSILDFSNVLLTTIDTI